MQHLCQTLEVIIRKGRGYIDDSARETQRLPPIQSGDRVGVEVAPVGVHRQVEPVTGATCGCQSFVERSDLLVQS